MILLVERLPGGELPGGKWLILLPLVTAIFGFHYISFFINLVAVNIANFITRKSKHSRNLVNLNTYYGIF